MTSLLAHSVWLPLVLCHSGVNSPMDPSAVDSSHTRSIESYWTISGRIGALKTLGRGCVCSLAEPSAEMMVTVGRLVMLAA